MPRLIGRRWPAPPVAAVILALHAFASQAPHAHLVAAVDMQRVTAPAPLFNGQTLAGWAVVGAGQWTVEDGVLVGQGGSGAAVLKSARTWANLVLQAEILVEDGAQTSIGVRCPERDAAPASARSCYRVSLNDAHPLFPTGSLVDYRQGSPRMTTAGEWTRVAITADGPRLVVRINDTVTAEVRDGRLTHGTITIETPSRGRVRVRNVQVAPVATGDAR
jgi:hypothetical protein